MNTSSTPCVSLVGAGPGDPELLTLRALNRLQAADVVLCDDLVDRRVLAMLRSDARVLHVGKRGGCVSTSQAFIHQLMLREAREGKRVVRLKGGDPFVFGRGGEECQALREAGIEVEVVPGITSGIAAPAAVGIPVTDRRHAPGVAFITGHNRADAQSGAGPDWAALARSGLTLVIYMGLARCEALVAELRAAGMDGDMPAAAIAAAHTPQQRQLLCTLDGLAQGLRDEQISSPAILVIGEVVREAHGWAELTQELQQRTALVG
ncbi:uroporphyrinogen-III C-methyltransferase [Roseateles toxinivorans]|uniref:uroporphyrinogen-III C-methyltransferase n=1 Tax=Roseateles toxinivorans TaxID=270368 RepID=A0A4R6QRC8_9BURK|nr:uroporphyrinogen-III C-methyltransferase [Roseateles toxinivorans]TDP73307.1 uroporphyrin-III C-methyltransferase [Roseateles toxinivorans]